MTQAFAYQRNVKSLERRKNEKNLNSGETTDSNGTVDIKVDWGQETGGYLSFKTWTFHNTIGNSEQEFLSFSIVSLLAGDMYVMTIQIIWKLECWHYNICHLSIYILQIKRDQKRPRNVGFSPYFLLFFLCLQSVHSPLWSSLFWGQ